MTQPNFSDVYTAESNEMINDGVETQQSRRPNVLVRRIAGMAAVLGAGSLALSTCGGGDNDSVTIDSTIITTELSTSSTTTSGIENQNGGFNGLTPVITSDEQLATGDSLNGNFYCGGGYDMQVNGEVSTVDLSYKMDFLLQNPEIKQGAYDVLVTDRIYGIGEKGAKIIAESSLAKPETVAIVGDKTLGDVELDKLLVNNLWTVELQKDTLVENGTCRFGGVEMPARDIPKLLLKAGTTVEGYILEIEDFNRLSEVATNLNRFYVYTVAMPNDDGEDEIFKFVMTASNGCDNPARIPVDTTEITIPTTSNPTVTTSVPDKRPTGTDPRGGGGSGGDPENGDDPENDSDDDGYGPGDREIVDIDGDGIHNAIDLCPNQAETWNGYQDNDGCPDTAPTTTSDDITPTTGVPPVSTNPPVVATTIAPIGTPENPTEGTAPLQPGFEN